jgi:hypothetical protein
LLFSSHHEEPSESAKTLTTNQTLKTIWNVVIDSKHPQLRAWEKSLALFENLVGDNLQKIFSYHLFSLAKLLYKHIFMHFCASSPNPLMLVFAD